MKVEVRKYLNGVTESENFEKPSHRSPQPVAGRRRTADEISLLISEDGSVDRTFSKDHHVLRQGPGLVRKEELDVAKLLVQVARVAFCRLDGSNKNEVNR